MKKRRILFNDNWRFTLTEPDSDGKTLENAHWYNVEIPHDWLIGDTANLYKSGCGWYEKYFTVDALGEDDCYILIFDGVYMDTTVYVNDKEVGKWKYGYTTFSFDITDALKNGENRILVRVNHKSPNTVGTAEPEYTETCGSEKPLAVTSLKTVSISAQRAVIQTAENTANGRLLYR